MVKRRGRKRTKSELPKIHSGAAGIDVGSRFHVVAVPPECDEEPVRTFQSFTGDLNRLADWLESVGVRTVAMESTGVYWIPVYEILEARGLEVLLVNARAVKNVPGRKTDVKDAQWIQRLHEYGLVRGSFRPREDVAALRAYLRHRERLVEYAAAHIQHMQKALMQMNVQLHHVVSTITGKTGMLIIRSILAGVRDPGILANHRDCRCKASLQVIAAALEGHYRDEHVFSLQQAVQLYDFYQLKIAECDDRLECALRAIESRRHDAGEPLPPARSKQRPRNEPQFEIRTPLHALLGVDLTQIHGFGPYTALRLVGECGNDMSRWPSSKHFTSWLSLAPGNKVSGGKLLASRTRPSSNRAATILRMAAVNVGKTQTAMGAFYRRLAARIGKAKAVTATACRAPS
jgi:transposase